MTQIVKKKTDMKEWEAIKQKDLKFNQNFKKIEEHQKNGKKIDDNITFQTNQANSKNLDEKHDSLPNEHPTSDKKDDFSILREKIRKSIDKEDSNRFYKRRKTDSLSHSNPIKLNLNKKLFISNELETPQKMAQKSIQIRNFSIEKEKVKTLCRPCSKKNDDNLRGSPVKEDFVEKDQYDNKINEVKIKKKEENTKKSIDEKNKKTIIVRKSNEDRVDNSFDKGKKKYNINSNITKKSLEKNKPKTNLKKLYTHENVANPSDNQIIPLYSHQIPQKIAKNNKTSEKNTSKRPNTPYSAEKAVINKSNQIKTLNQEFQRKSLSNENVQNILEGINVGLSPEDLIKKNGEVQSSNHFIQLDLEKQVELTYNENPTPHNLLESDWSEEKGGKNKEEEEEIVLGDNAIKMENDYPFDEEEQIVLTDQQEEFQQGDAEEIIYDKVKRNISNPTPNQTIEEPKPNSQILGQTINENHQKASFSIIEKQSTPAKEFNDQDQRLLSEKSDVSKRSKMEANFLIKNDKKCILKSNTPKSNESFNFQAKNFINLEDDDDEDELSLMDSPSPLLKRKMENNFVSKNKVKAKSDFEIPKEVNFNLGEMKKKPFTSGNYNEKKGIFMVLRKDIASMSQNKEEILKLIIKSLK